MELNSSVNTFIGGMNLDSDISLLKENQYAYAENIRLLANEDNTTGILQNRECLTKLGSFLTDEKILGTVETRMFDVNVNRSRECFIAITLTNDNKNSIYVVYVDDDNEQLLYRSIIHKKPLGFLSRLKIVSNYESDTVSKIYVADGKNPIKVINLMDDFSNKLLDESSFDILPSSILYQPKLLRITEGNLNVGTVQYAFQLFTKHGSESPISICSTLIQIPRKSSKTSSIQNEGGLEGEPSSVGCKIKFDYISDDFNMIRIYRIRYDKNNSIPRIFVVNEYALNGDYFVYNDIKDTYINEITVDEFNASTNQFIPNVIEKHQNRLFAANYLETIWDIDYDARAYRCDETGNITLLSNTDAESIVGTLEKDGTISGKSVDKKHDCINPSNAELFSELSFKYIYGWDGDKLVFGGTGPNISYKFCYTRVNLSDSVTTKASGDSLYYANFTNLSLKTDVAYDLVNILDENNNVVMQHTVDDSKKILWSYSDSYFTSNFLGYQRDEIYRFGIVFFDEKNRKSPVHWIGDIRMPGPNCSKTIDDKVYPFHFNDSFDNSEIKGYALGVQFDVRNVPDGIRWEIVRCPRTEIDRTIVAQGALSSLIQFDDWGDKQVNLGTSDIRPMGLLNLSQKYNVTDYMSSSSSYCKKLSVVDGYYEFISPEVCVSQQSIMDNLKTSVLCPLNWFTSYHAYDSGAVTGVAQQQSWCLRQHNINTLNASESTSKTNSEFGRYQRYSSDQYLVFQSSYSNSNGGLGNAGLLKYYKPMADTIINQYKIDDIILGNVLPRQYTQEEAKNYAQPIGDKNYVNTTIAARHYMNSHGRNAILKMDIGNTHAYFYMNQTTDVQPFTTMNSTRICNVKQAGVLYGGDGYSNRANSTYIACVKHDIDSNKCCVYGGDTYLNVFDYTHTTMRRNSNTDTDMAYTQQFMNCYIPLESTINTNLFSSDNYSDTVSGVGQYTYAQNLITYEPISSPTYSQTKPLYEYNSVYSVDANAQLFVPDLLYVNKRRILENRITCSELKNNNELSDSWTKFKFANYLDVDNQHGVITNLKSYNGKLFFWQDSAIGIAAVNERSLISDNNISMLTLGTGGILVRYDYYNTLNGSCVINDRSICNSVSTIYWYDSSKREICAINDNVIELSKVKGVKSWCNKLDKQDAIGWYDWKYNEVLFRHPADESERSLVFNEQLNIFTSFYTYPSDYVIQLSNKVLTLDSKGNVYTHGSKTNYKPFNSRIRFIVNKGYPETKVFDNVWFDANFAKKEILSRVIFSTKNQITHPINYNNIEIREDTYRFPIGRDKNGVARMRGKYLICDYTFDCTNDGDFKIPYIKTTFRISRV